MGARTLLGKEMPLVGRRRELAILEAALGDPFVEPAARVAFVTGPAGIGKSRLRFEFLRRLGARGKPFELLFGRGDPLRADSPFGLLGPAIRRSAGILEGEEQSARYEKLRARLGRHLDPEALDRVAEFVGELADVPNPGRPSEALQAARADAVLMGDGTRAAWLDWLAAECASLPVMLVLEDVHWGDRSSFGLVDAALERLRDRPFHFLAVGRPEVHERLQSSARDVVEVRLGPLSRGASETLVREALGADVEAANVERIVEQAGGNAFYLEELIRAFAAGTRDVLPESVMAMARARLDALGEAPMSVVRAASVFGLVFWRGGVMALLRDLESEENVEEQLHALVASEVTVRRQAAVFPGDDEFAFRSVLLRDAAYAATPEEDRVRGHRLAAEWLERVGETDAILLAEHSDRGGEVERAIGWYLRGAEQALEANDLGGAIERAEKAIVRGASGRTLGMLLLAQAEAFRWRGEMKECEAVATKALLALAPGSEDWFRVLEILVVAAGHLGHVEEAMAWIRDGMRADREADSERAWVRFVCESVSVATMANRQVEADTLARRLEDVAKGLGRLDPATEARVHVATAFRGLARGDYGALISGFGKAATLFQRVGDVRGACRAQHNLGVARAEVGDFAESGRILREAIAGAERAALSAISPVARSSLASVLRHLGYLEEARAVAGKAIVGFLAQSQPKHEAIARAYLSAIILADGDAVGAEKEARLAADRVAQTPAFHGPPLVALARALLAQGRAEEAVTTAEEAFLSIESHAWSVAVSAEAWLVRAEALVAAGRAKEAADALADARARLLERAERIRDPGLRESFLHLVPEHARTLELASAQAADGGSDDEATNPQEGPITSSC